MKKLIFIFCLFCGITINAQDTTPGWYIVEASAKYLNYTEHSEREASYSNGEVLPDTGSYFLGKGEVLFVASFENNMYTCFDPVGQMIIVKGKSSLSKVPAGAGVGLITEAIDLIDGETIDEGLFVWITGQDVGKGTIKIRLHAGKEFDIPKANIALFTATIKKEVSKLEFKSVE